MFHDKVTSQDDVWTLNHHGQGRCSIRNVGSQFPLFLSHQDGRVELTTKADSWYIILNGSDQYMIKGTAKQKEMFLGYDPKKSSDQPVMITDYGAKKDQVTVQIGKDHLDGKERELFNPLKQSLTARVGQRGAISPSLFNGTAMRRSISQK